MADAPLTPDQIDAISDAGAGPVADLARQCDADPTQDFSLTATTIRDFGAGFTPDLMRMSYVPPPPAAPYTANIVIVRNSNPAIVNVSPTDYPYFTIDGEVTFAGTGMTTLDGNTFEILGVNGTQSSFTVNADCSVEQKPSNTGTVTMGTVLGPPVRTILTDPPPRPVLEPVIPNGYEQWAADVAAAAKGN